MLWNLDIFSVDIYLCLAALVFHFILMVLGLHALGTVMLFKFLVLCKTHNLLVECRSYVSSQSVMRLMCHNTVVVLYIATEVGTESFKLTHLTIWLLKFCDQKVIRLMPVHLPGSCLSSYHHSHTRGPSHHSRCYRMVMVIWSWALCNVHYNAASQFTVGPARPMEIDVTVGSPFRPDSPSLTTVYWWLGQ